MCASGTHSFLCKGFNPLRPTLEILFSHNIVPGHAIVGELERRSANPERVILSSLPLSCVLERHISTPIMEAIEGLVSMISASYRRSSHFTRGIAVSMVLTVNCYIA